MRAVIYQGIEQIIVEDAPVPEIGPKVFETAVHHKDEAIKVVIDVHP